MPSPIKMTVSHRHDMTKDYDLWCIGISRKREKHETSSCHAASSMLVLTREKTNSKYTYDAKKDEKRSRPCSKKVPDSAEASTVVCLAFLPIPPSTIVSAGSG